MNTTMTITTSNAINELQDAGRKMLAKKDSFSTWYDSMTCPIPSDYASIEPARCNPIPPYKTLLKKGTSEFVCNLVEYVRQLTPVRPKGRMASRNMPRFVERLELARKAILGLLSEGEESQDFYSFLNTANWERNHEFEIEIRRHLTLADCKRLDNIRVSKSWNDKFTLYVYSNNKTKNHLAYNAGYTDTLEELANNIKGVEEKKESADEKTLKKIGIYRRREEGKSVYYVGAYATGRVHLLLSKDFDNVEECKEFYYSHKQELCEALKEAGKTPNLRVHVNLWRNGANSQYANYSNEEFMAKFGLSGITYGNYVNNIARQAKLNATWDAFEDLAEACGIPCEKIGLSGLGLQFGASGTGHALAHFRAGDNSINLTRDKGDGALAHEWGHALDCRLRAIFAPLSHQTYATCIYKIEGVYCDCQLFGVDIANSLAAFREIMAIINGTDKNSMLHRSERYGRANKKYWANPQELFARAFEAFVQYETKGINAYLVSFSKPNAFTDSIAKGTRDELSSYPYPTEEEIEKMAPLFRELMRGVKNVL